MLQEGKQQQDMISISISEVKTFMNHLLCRETFDAFHLTEAVLTTYGLFTFDGHIHKDYYDKEEYEALYKDGYPLARWKQLRPVFFDLIKGKHTPLSFSIVFQMSRSGTEKFLSALDTSFTLEDINGLFLNLRYDAGQLTAVTGTSLKIFSLDRSLEQAWDSKIQKFILSL